MSVRHDYDPKALTAARRREASKRGTNMVGRGSGLTPRIRKAIDLLVFGDERDLNAVMRLQDAAEAANITSRALRAAMLKPAVDAYYQQQMIALRNGERAASIRTMAAIRDDPTLRGNAAGATARLKAATALAFDPPGAPQVNVQLNATTQVTPGYVINLRSERREQIEHEVGLPQAAGQAGYEGA